RQQVGSRQEAQERGEEQERRDERESEIVRQSCSPLENLVLSRPCDDSPAELSQREPAERPGRRHPAARLATLSRQRSHLAGYRTGAEPSRKAPSHRTCLLVR